MIKGLRTTIYKVSDLERAKQWYGEAFAAKPYFDEPFYVGFTLGGFELGLDPDLKNAQPGAGGVLTYWGVDDLKKTYAHFLQVGATEHEAPHNVGGTIEVASVVDPFGNIIGLIFNPEFDPKSVR